LGAASAAGEPGLEEEASEKPLLPILLRKEKVLLPILLRKEKEKVKKRK
jgi:hypothetical protein